MATGLLIAAVFWLAWSNGANDNFKGVATLYGSGAASYRTALMWATAATLAGCLLSIVAASGLVKAFSGSGLLPANLVQSPSLLLAVATAGAATIFLATMLGMPTSTTHALTGGLVGAGLAATSGGASGGAGINWATLGQKFAQPLLVSPVLAIAGAAVLYIMFRTVRLALGIERHACICIGRREYVPVTVGGMLNSRRVAQTMSRRITELNHGQGLTANLVMSGSSSAPRISECRFRQLTSPAVPSSESASSIAAGIGGQSLRYS